MIPNHLIFDFVSIKNLFPDFILLNEQQNIVQTSTSLQSFYSESGENKFLECFTIDGKEKQLASYFGKDLCFKSLGKKKFLLQARVEYLKESKLILLVVVDMKAAKARIKNELNFHHINHAIASPLTAIQSSLDLIQKHEHKKSSELSLSTKRYFDSALFEIKAITSILNNSSVLLENETAFGPKSETDIIQLINNSIEAEFSALFENAKYTISFHGKKRAIKTHQPLMSILFVNIIHELIKNASTNLTIEITVFFTIRSVKIIFKNINTCLPLQEIDMLEHSINTNAAELFSAKALAVTAIKKIAGIHHAVVEIRKDPSNNLSFIFNMRNS